MMKILAALVFLSVTAGVRPADQVTCQNPILCPCGDTGKNVSVCTEEGEQGDACSRWSKCKTCQDGSDSCLECPQGLEGPMCMKGPEKSSRQNSFLYNYGGNRWSEKNQQRRVAQQGNGGCPEIRSPKLGSIRCLHYERARTCRGKCLPGYSFEGHAGETEMVLSCRGDYFTPLTEFPSCKSAGHCELIVEGGGSFNCTMGMSGTFCDVVCSGRGMGRYFCYPERDWEPNLPRCVRPKEVQGPRQTCSCQHGGSCDSNGNCVCPTGTTGRFCEKTVSSPEVLTYCRDLGVDPNGSRNPQSPPSHQGFPQGSRLVYFCDQGYDLDGENSVFCLTSGRWSSERPTCRSQPTVRPQTYCRDPGMDPNGGRNVPSPPDHRGFLEGSRLEYFCNPGYDVDGDRSIFCLSSGIWSSRRPTCNPTTHSPLGIEPVTCLKPEPISNGRIVFYPPVNRRRGGKPQIVSDKLEYPVGGYLLYTCDIGYKLEGRDSRTCDRNRRWSPEPPVCRRNGDIMFCSNPGPLSNGQIVYYPPLTQGHRGLPQNDLNNAEYPSGGLLLYFCNTGYSIRGRDSLTCNEDGKWSSSPPACRASVDTTENFCQDPGVDANGSRNPRRPLTRRGFRHGTRLEYSCNQGYELEGEKILICLSSGDWLSGTPQCKPEIFDPEPEGNYCDNPGHIANGKIEYIPSLDQRRPRPRVDSEEYVEYPEGTRLLFSCDNGYLLAGESELTCKETGEWSDKYPRCQTREVQRIMYCYNPRTILNGNIYHRDPLARPRTGSTSLVAEDTPQYPEGTILEFKCDDGYFLAGSPILTCHSTGQWSAYFPKCIPDCGISMTGLMHKVGNGTKTEAGEWPWVVAIAIRVNNYTRIICGGAVLNTRTVITAAHCLTRADQYILYFGKYHRNNSLDDKLVEERTSDRLIIYPTYNRTTQDSDIALIKFKNRIYYTERVQPICLPTYESTEFNLNVGQKGYVTGWGDNEKQRLSDELMMAHLPFQPLEACAEAFRITANFNAILTGNMFCAGYFQSNQSVCEGDSGSPFVFLDPSTGRHIIEGIVSFSVEGECGQKGVYSVYTKVFMYTSWIYLNMN